jgi:DNA-directed RNA polymerase subunit RPC12/RpoP
VQSIGDGVSIQVGQQAWLGVAASLGISAFAAFRNPFALLSRLDDIAQDIEYIQLSDEIWKVIEDTARTLASTHQLSERLLRIECEYCGTANPVGEAHCIACGAPLGSAQPTTCARCGYVLVHGEKNCPNCGAPIYR